VAKTGRCVIVHEAARTGGFGGEIAALIAERGLTSLLAPIARVTRPTRSRQRSALDPRRGWWRGGARRSRQPALRHSGFKIRPASATNFLLRPKIASGCHSL
jgi:hypothetical protein